MVLAPGFELLMYIGNIHKRRLLWKGDPLKKMIYNTFYLVKIGDKGRNPRKGVHIVIELEATSFMDGPLF